MRWAKGKRGYESKNVKAVVRNQGSSEISPRNGKENCPDAAGRRSGKRHLRNAGGRDGAIVARAAFAGAFEESAIGSVPIVDLVAGR